MPSEEAWIPCGQRRGRRRPTMADIEEHRRTHLPYRSWCPVCIAARATNPGHPRRDEREALEEDRDLEMVAYDYAFFRKATGEESEAILASKDKSTRMLHAHVVPQKGVVIDWVIQQAKRDIERLGHWNNLTLRSDQEPSLVQVLEAIARIRGDRRTVIEHSPVGESQANGFIERGVRSVEEMTRVITLDLERRIGTSIGVQEAIFSWIVEHAADLINKCQVSADRKTLYET